MSEWFISEAHAAFQEQTLHTVRRSCSPVRLPALVCIVLEHIVLTEHIVHIKLSSDYKGGTYRYCTLCHSVWEWWYLCQPFHSASQLRNRETPSKVSTKSHKLQCAAGKRHKLTVAVNKERLICLGWRDWDASYTLFCNKCYKLSVMAQIPRFIVKRPRPP